MLEQSFQVSLGLFVKVMFLAESLSKLDSSVALVDNNTLLLVSTQVDIDEKQGRVGVIEIVFLILVSVDDFLTVHVLLLLLLLILDRIRNLVLVCYRIDLFEFHLCQRNQVSRSIQRNQTYMNVGLRLD